jgi:ActR/RegA family two-component response regulator
MMHTSTQLPDVLMIDDDPSFCLAMSKALRRRGFKVEVVQDSDQAIIALHKATTNTVAVLDLKMPKRSGLEILQETKKKTDGLLF